MKWLGLTGSIATGKSTVAGLLRKNGYRVVDADEVAREVVKSGTVGFDNIVKTFGRTMVQSDGELDRQKLGDLIFKDSEKRQELERMIHPLVQKRVAEIRYDLETASVPIAFYDVPLLFEKNLQSQFEATIVVVCSPQTQLKRLIKRNGFTREQAMERMAAQMSTEKKIDLADYVIKNEGTLEDLELNTNACLKKIMAS